MGSLTGGVVAKRPWFLCLHGFRTSDKIMLKQLVGNCTAEVTARFDLVFADAPFPAEGKSDVDDIFHPPYYEWFQFDKVLHPPPSPLPLVFPLPHLSVFPNLSPASSKLQTGALKEAITQVVADAKEKKMKFT
ncbi:hypothetical protein ZWY2020_003051 [Hordeum vulgare]|nr:hypothetical protein ZWY2020_003051 [Hordeum vulgare]